MTQKQSGEVTYCNKCNCMTHSIRKGRAHYECGKCGHDNSLSDVFQAEVRGSASGQKEKTDSEKSHFMAPETQYKTLPLCPVNFTERDANRKIKCGNCKKECPCNCLEVEFEQGYYYFCSKKCLDEIKEKTGIDLENEEYEHWTSCRQKGFYKKKWVDELQKDYFLFNRLYYEFHREWKKEMENKEKLFDVIVKKLLDYCNDELGGEINEMKWARGFIKIINSMREKQ